MYEQLQQGFLDALNGISDQAQTYYSILSQKNETNISWCRNFRESKPVVSELIQSTTSLKTKVECLQTVVQQNSSPRRVCEMQTKLASTLDMMNQFCLFNNIRRINGSDVVGALTAESAEGLENSARYGIAESPTRRYLTF